ncbi:MAG: hypothetical protein DRN57_08485, partial [Thermoplasmata archaeon]
MSSREPVDRAGSPGKRKVISLKDLDSARNKISEHIRSGNDMERAISDVLSESIDEKTARDLYEGAYREL